MLQLGDYILMDYHFQKNSNNRVTTLTCPITKHQIVTFLHKLLSHYASCYADIT